ncbi:cyclic peptide export ABC transporter [Rugamonas sp. CCM 8940]|uniref:cyclic peptide export ABC transporter n=1 Tax=Rugamonas sp. CCM 8940 TaxID=2765359 RepID=UPI0018F7B7C4|nr:cyclic peptide export ABC transporter [Rugamonas sp. CCM 8940]MBJ7311024.1 cyclic peptide export ABC transporter [Rugamonas sp. CCM 8940]
MNLLKYLYQRSSYLLILACVCAIFGGLASAALVKVIAGGITGSVQGADFALSFFGLCIVVLVARTSSQISILHLTQNAVMDMRISLSKKLMDSPYKKLQELGKPGLLVILTKDIDAFTSALQAVPRILTEGIVIVACFSYLAWLSLPLFGLLTLTLVVCLVAFNKAQRYPFHHLRLVRTKMDNLYQHFRDLVEGSRELQLNKQRGRAFVDQVIAPDAKQFRDIYIRGFSAYTWISNVGDILFYIAIGILLFVVPLWLPQSPAVLTSVTLVLLYLIGPISSMINAVPSLGQASIALRRIQQLDNTLSEQLMVLDRPNPFKHKSSCLIELDAVSHHYPGKTDDSKFLLGPVSLRVEAGEILFIVGGNGSGKTTLAMLLLGLYMPESGCVRMNGASVTEENIEHYRQNFSAVFSDFYLFEHLLGVAPETIMAQSAHYLDKLHMTHKVKVVDGRFSTIDLSAGQKKRLALVGAYLEDRSIYLFDEWAADQDPAFKRVFYTELLPELKARGKTVIVISHDDAYFGCADRIIKLADGNVDAPAVQQHAAVLHAV